MALVPTTRLAPSPTGALHLGNSRTFAITWALACQRGWKIVLRIEDLDGPRIKRGAAQGAIDTLAWLGFTWDEGPIVQSHDLEPYRAAMRSLASRALAYPSPMTRAQVEAQSERDALSAPQEGSHEAAFPATLRPALAPIDFDPASISPAAWRFATPPEIVEFEDAFAGPQRHTPASTIGDFIVWTRHGHPAYQLAVVVDDARQGVTHVVRGNDLLDSAARQLLLYRALALPNEPTHTHLPLVRGADGKRLAKRHGDTRIDHYRARGVPVERVIGLIAFWSGVLPRREPLTLEEFARAFNLATLSASDITFTPEDDAWLLSR
jgi:glutamyl-tRNA synthetase